MAIEIVGREEELRSLQAFVDDARHGPATLVLEGEAGIGKSTLWEAGVAQARAQGLTVLSSRPAEAERALGHVGLVDLLEGVVDDVLSALLTPRRRALQVALLREEASGDPVDRRTLAVAVRDALQLLSERGPILIAVDDVQWLDPSSSRALAFALRRLDASPVSLLLARRLVEGAPSSRSSNARWVRTASGRYAWGRSARGRSIGSCAIGWERRSRARRCSGSTSGRVGIRSSRWSWPAFSLWTSTRFSRFRFPRRSKSS